MHCLQFDHEFLGVWDLQDFGKKGMKLHEIVLLVADLGLGML